MTLGAVCQNAVILLAFDLQFSHTGFAFRILLYLLTQRAALRPRQNELSHLRGRDEALFQTGQNFCSGKYFNRPNVTVQKHHKRCFERVNSSTVQFD